MNKGCVSYNTGSAVCTQKAQKGPSYKKIKYLELEANLSLCFISGHISISLASWKGQWSVGVGRWDKSLSYLKMGQLFFTDMKEPGLHSGSLIVSENPSCYYELTK